MKHQLIRVILGCLLSLPVLRAGGEDRKSVV